MHSPHRNPVVIGRARQRGAALLLVLFALMIATVLAMTFAGGSATSVAIARNIDRQAQARAIAESGLDIAISYIQNHDDWRDIQVHGDWLIDQSFGGGTFTIRGEDEDGDLSDDASDIVRLIAVGRFDGVSHRVEAEVTPGSTISTGGLLFVVADASNLNNSDGNKRSLFQDWGYTVALISDDASASEFDAALADTDVVFVSETVYSSTVGTKLSATSVGVVSEEGYLSDELGVSSSRNTHLSNELDITDTTHGITSSFSSGTVTIADADVNRYTYSGTIGAGVATPAQRTGTSSPALAVLDIGDTDHQDNASPGRRVMLPWGPTAYGFDSLNDAGRTLIQRSLQWAATEPTFTNTPLARWALDDTDGSTASDSVGNHDGSVFGGTVVSQSGANGTAYFFDGSDDHVEVSHHNDFLLDEGSVSFWFNAEAMSGTQALISKDSNGYDNGGHLHVYLEGSTLKVRFQSTSQSYTIMSPSGLSADTWYHGVFTFGNDGMRLYLDGVEADNDAYTGGMATTSGGTGNYEPMIFGAGTWSSGNLTKSSLNQHYEGKLDQVALFDEQLSASLVQAMYQSEASNEEPEGETPSLIALYTFEPVIVTPTLVGHWKLDESSANGGGGMAADDRLEIKDYAVVNSYDSSQGVYGGTNVGAQANVSTNSTSNNRLDIKTNATLNGNAYVGVGGDPDSVIDQDGTITGSKAVLASDVPMPDFSAPSGMPSTLGNTTYSTDQTWTTDLTFGKLTIQSNAIVTVSGNVRIYCTNTFKVEDSAKIIVPAGSSLTIYVDKNVQIKENAIVNEDSDGTGRLTILVIASNKDFVIEDDASASAVIRARRDIKVKDNAVVFGSLIAQDDIYVEDNAQVHLDLSLPTLGAAATPAVDQITGNDGLYTNGATPGVGGHGDGGTAADFDGDNDYIAIPHHGSYLLDQGAVSLWFRSDSLSGRRELFSKDSWGYDSGGHLTIYTTGSTLETRLQSSSVSYYVNQSGLSTGQWYHVVFTWGPGGMELFLNGVSVDTETHTGGIADSTEPIALGGNTWQSDDGTVTPIQDHFDGRIDEVRLYDARLDATQADELYQRSDPSPAVTPVVFDVSGYGTAVDLAIDDPSAVSWIGGGGLDITADVTIASSDAATKLHDTLTTTGEYALEVVFTPANITQEGPAGIASYSAGTSSRNFTLGQDEAAYLHRLRTTDTVSNGTPDTVSSDVLVADQQQHIIVSFKDEQVTLYRNGSEELTEARTGDLGDWDNTMRFVLGNEIGGSRPWHGKLHRVAIYDRGFNALQAANVFAGGEPGDGTGDAQAFKIVWDENP